MLAASGAAHVVVLAASDGDVAVAPVVGLVVLAYLLGTFPTALLAGRLRGVDPTATGSGNPGTTNVLRTAGRRAAALTLLGDVGKGAVAAGLGWLAVSHGVGVACGLAAVLGHVAPVTRRFKGGKGVATGAGMALVLFPLAALAAVAGFAAAFALTRVASVASLTASAVLPLVAALAGAPGLEVAALVAGAVLVFARHVENIRRLVRGEESRARLGR